MKIRMLAMWVSGLGSFDVDSTPEIEDSLAKELIAAGYAEAYVATDPTVSSAVKLNAILSALSTGPPPAEPATPSAAVAAVAAVAPVEPTLAPAAPVAPASVPSPESPAVK